MQAVLERALASKSGQHCGLLWRASIGFELLRGRPEAARKTFLRGIHACPWSKVCASAPIRESHIFCKPCLLLPALERTAQ